MTGTLQLAPVIPRRTGWRRHRVAIGVTLLLAGPALGAGAEVARVVDAGLPRPSLQEFAGFPSVPVVEGPAQPTMSTEAPAAHRLRRAVYATPERPAMTVTVRAPSATSAVVSSRPSSGARSTTEAPTSAALTPSAAPTSAPSSSTATSSPVMTTTPGLPAHP